MQCMQLKRQAGNYLRVRGEYAALDRFRTTGVELPPRARRILRKENHAHHSAGTTSACAENTIPGIPGRLCRRNYLRVRGEYCRQPGLFLILGELPPRARRIRKPPIGVGFPSETTSACAENTGDDVLLKITQRNYLRVRGEYM